MRTEWQVMVGQLTLRPPSYDDVDSDERRVLAGKRSRIGTTFGETNCAVCGKPYTRLTPNSITCSELCKHKNRVAKQKARRLSRAG